MSPLTSYQQEVLDRLEESLSSMKTGDGPWERAWRHPSSPAESRAMASLYRRGLIDRQPGRVSAKIPHQYRALSPLPESSEVIS